MAKNRGLTDKQRLFCLEYIKDFNATAAYIRAGYSKTGARTSACRLLTNGNIQSELKRQKDKRAQRTQITVDRVVQELARIGFGNPKDAMTWGKRQIEDGNGNDIGQMPYVDFEDSDKIPDEVAAMIAEVKITNGVSGPTMSMKMHDKLRALEMLSKHVGLYDDKKEDSGKGLVIEVRRIEKSTD